RRALQRLVIIIPGAAHVPPPAVAAVAPFVAPAPAFPCQRTAIEVPAVVATREPRITRECRMIGVARTPGMGNIARPARGRAGRPPPARGGGRAPPPRPRGGGRPPSPGAGGGGRAAHPLPPVAGRTPCCGLGRTACWYPVCAPVTGPRCTGAAFGGGPFCGGPPPVCCAAAGSDSAANTSGINTIEAFVLAIPGVLLPSTARPYPRHAATVPLNRTRPISTDCGKPAISP